MMDVNLKPCPFCGGEVEMLKKKVGYGSTTRKKIPEGAVLVGTENGPSYQHGGIVTRLRWEKYGYTVRCKTTNCYCRTGLAHYETELLAASAWNSRKESKAC